MAGGRIEALDYTEPRNTQAKSKREKEQQGRKVDKRIKPIKNCGSGKRGVCVCERERMQKHIKEFRPR